MASPASFLCAEASRSQALPGNALLPGSAWLREQARTVNPFSLYLLPTFLLPVVAGISAATRLRGDAVSLVKRDGGDCVGKAQPIKTLGRAKAFSDAGQRKPRPHNEAVRGEITSGADKPGRLDWWGTAPKESLRRACCHPLSRRSSNAAHATDGRTLSTPEPEPQVDECDELALVLRRR
jgi:hypothetical protein